MHHLFDLLIFLPFCGVFSASHSAQESKTTTQTTSGAGSPNASDTGTAVASGSVGVGSQGKYQETGAVDLSNAPGAGSGGTVGAITTGGGSTVTIGDTNALGQVSALAQQFSDAVQGVASQTPAAVQSALAGQPNAPAGQTIGTNAVYLALAVLGSILAWLFISKKSA